MPQVQQSVDFGVWSCTANGGATGWTCIRVRTGRLRSLEGEPFLEACAAICMEAVEERQRLEENICTYLQRSAKNIWVFILCESAGMAYRACKFFLEIDTGI